MAVEFAVAVLQPIQTYRTFLLLHWLLHNAFLELTGDSRRLIKSHEIKSTPGKETGVGPNQLSADDLYFKGLDLLSCQRKVAAPGCAPNNQTMAKMNITNRNTTLATAAPRTSCSSQRRFSNASNIQPRQVSSQQMRSTFPME